MGGALKLNIHGQINCLLEKRSKAENRKRFLERLSNRPNFLTVIPINSQFSDNCLSWCKAPLVCFEMDRMFTNGSHYYIRGCWEQGSDDALKRTGCMAMVSQVFEL